MKGVFSASSGVTLFLNHYNKTGEIKQGHIENKGGLKARNSYSLILMYEF